MSKFDRGVFIFIGLGIWALAMTQIFKPSILDAKPQPRECGTYNESMVGITSYGSSAKNYEKLKVQWLNNIFTMLALIEMRLRK